MAAPTKLEAHLLFSALDSGGTEGGKAQLELVAVFPETGSDAGQATLNSSAGFIVSEVDRVRSRPLPSPPHQHEDFVSVGHGADAGSTDKSLSRSLTRTPPGSEVAC